MLRRRCRLIRSSTRPNTVDRDRTRELCFSSQLGSQVGNCRANIGVSSERESRGRPYVRRLGCISRLVSRQDRDSALLPLRSHTPRRYAKNRYPNLYHCCPAVITISRYIRVSAHRAAPHRAVADRRDRSRQNDETIKPSTGHTSSCRHTSGA